MRKTEYLFVFLMGIILLNFFVPSELNPTVFLISVYGLFLVYLYLNVETLYLNKKLEFSRKSAVFIISLLGAFILSSLNGAYLSLSRDYLLLLLGYIFIFNTVQKTTLKESRIWFLLGSLVVAASLISIYSIGQYLTGFYGLEDSVNQVSNLAAMQKEAITARLASERIFGFFPFPTTLSAFLATIIPLSLGLLKKIKSGAFRFLLIFSLLLQGTAMYLTKSFGGVVTLMGVLTFTGIFILVKKKTIPLKLLSLSTLAVLVIVGFIIVFGLSRGGLFEINNPKNPIVLRLANWNAAAEIAADHPAFGVGPGNYATVFPKYYRPNTQPSRFAHNSYLQLACEIGIFQAITLFFLIAAWFLKALGKGYKPSASPKSNKNLLFLTLLTSTLAFLINNLFEINIYYASLGFFGIFISSLFGKVAYQKQESSEECLYLPAFERTSSPEKLREKHAVAFLLALWMLMTVLVFQRFIGQAFYNSASDNYKTGRIEAAEGNVNFAKFVDPFDSNYHLLHSLTNLEKYKKGKDSKYIDKALFSAEKAVELNPHTPNLRKNFSTLLFLRGRIWKSLYQIQFADYLFKKSNKYKPDIKFFYKKVLKLGNSGRENDKGNKE